MQVTPRRLTATLIAATAAVASFGIPAAAGSGVDKDAYTLIQDANALVGDAPMRFDLAMEIIGAPISFGDEPMMTGSAVGNDVDITLDMESMLAGTGMSPSMFGVDDLNLHMRVIGTDVYLAGGLLQLMGVVDPEFTQFAAMGDGWGFIDAAQVPDFNDIINQMSGGGSPTEALAALDAVETAEITGTADVDGETMTVVRIIVAGEQLAEITGDSNPFAQGDLSVPYDVYIDAEGYPRQMVIHLDEDTIGAADPDNSLGGLAMSMTMTMRFFDYNDPTISIEAPADAIDITADFVRMSELGV